MDRGAELIGVYDGLSVNIVQISISKKPKIFGGGLKLQVKGNDRLGPAPRNGIRSGTDVF